MTRNIQAVPYVVVTYNDSIMSNGQVKTPWLQPSQKFVHTLAEWSEHTAGRTEQYCAKGWPVDTALPQSKQYLTSRKRFQGNLGSCEQRCK